MRTTFSRPAIAVSILAFALGSVPARAGAQEQLSAADAAQARQLLNEGLELRTRGELTPALERLKAAHALVHTPITGVELARTYLQLGKLVEARETFLSVDRIPRRPEETARSKTARLDAEKAAGELRPRVPSLRVRVTGTPSEDVAVAIDEAAIPAEAVGTARFLDPGRHKVSARSTAGAHAEAEVDLAEGEQRDVELNLAPANHSPATPTSDVAPAPGLEASKRDAGSAARPPTSHLLQWSLLGGGAAVAAVGVSLMVVGSGKASDAVQALDRSAYDSAKTLWTVGLVGAIVGGAAVAGGGIVFAVGSAKNKGDEARAPLVRVDIGANAVTLRGMW